MAGKFPDRMTEAGIKNAVKEKYGRVAEDPGADFNFPVGKEFALKVGYPAKVLDKLPKSLYDSFTGANNPQPFTNVKKGDIVLDLGCGAGLDLYFYAKAAGKTGRVFGLDISEEMTAKAAKNMELAGVTNAEPITGHSDRLPFDSGFFDIVASNGIYNLSPDKGKVMKEVFRVLKPGGRTALCEIMVKKNLPEKAKDIKDWFRCIGGAVTLKEFTVMMKKAGFKDIKVLSLVRNARTGHELAVCANITARKEKK